MIHTDCPTSIVVGIDGSEAAVRAAQWAVDEAMSRDLPLRLLHIIEPGSEAVRLENEYAQIALETARGAVELLSPRVHVQTAIKRGGIDAVLARESRTAELICIGASASESLDEPSGRSTSAAFARSARCPVVVVGNAGEPVASEIGCVAVIVDGSESDDLMLRDAWAQASIRKYSVLAMSREPVVGEQKAASGWRAPQ